MTEENSGTARTLPAFPGVVLRDTIPARLALRLIEKAIHYGWHDDQAEAALTRGRQALQGPKKWRSNPTLDADLIKHRHGAFRWLAIQATPLGFELRDYDEAIVLSGRSDIL